MPPMASGLGRPPRIPRKPPNPLGKHRPRMDGHVGNPARGFTPQPQPSTSKTTLNGAAPLNQPQRRPPPYSFSVIEDSDVDEENHMPPTQKRIFATFKPPPPSSGVAMDADNPSLEGSDRRIVVELDASGQYIWRFVPLAERAPGENDAGWPRMIDFRGRPIFVTQDQWDALKLDPRYRCYIPKSPLIPTVTFFTKQTTFPSSSGNSAQAAPARGVPANSAPGVPAHSQPAIGKRHSPPTPGDDRSAKRMRPAPVSMMSDDDSDLDTDLDTDIELLAASLRISPEPEANAPLPPAAREKRRQSNSDVVQPKAAKRPRLESPRGFNQAEVYARLSHQRTEREKEKKRKQDEQAIRLRAEREQVFWASIDWGNLDWDNVRQQFMESPVPEPDPLLRRSSSFMSREQAGTGASGVGGGEDGMNEDEDEETARERLIAESKRKLAELERDKPLWEDMARKRRIAEEKERETEERKKREREEWKRREEEKAMRDKAQEMAEKLKRLKAERERLAKEQKWGQWDRLYKQQQSSSRNQWTTQRALSNYRSLCTSFDSAKFTASSPLQTHAVPWPVLHPPNTSLKYIDWASVETFFDMVHSLVPKNDWKDLVKGAHRRFHPDKWRSRGLFGEAGAGKEVERTVEHVGKVMGALWENAKDQ